MKSFLKEIIAKMTTTYSKVLMICVFNNFQKMILLLDWEVEISRAFLGCFPFCGQFILCLVFWGGVVVIVPYVSSAQMVLCLAETSTSWFLAF